MEPMPRGKKCFYPNKKQDPLSFNLTVGARTTLKETEARTGRSRSDVLEFLVRNFSERVVFPERLLSPESVPDAVPVHA